MFVDKIKIWEYNLAVITQASAGNYIAKMPWLLASSGDSKV